MIMSFRLPLLNIDPSPLTFIIQVIAGVVIAAGAAVGFYGGV